MGKTEPDLRNAAIVFNNDGMGHGDESLRKKLATNYLRTVYEGDFRPESILLYASGVKLATLDSPCREALSQLAAQGTRIVACRTCLEFYGLMEQVPEAEIGNMLMILEAQAAATKVVTL